MSQKEKRSIEKIHSGRIDFYIPFTIETKQNYSEVCRKIAECIGREISDHLDGIKTSMQESLSEFPYKIHIQPEKIDKRKGFLGKFFSKKKVATKSKFQAIGSASFEIEPFTNGMKLSIFPEETEVYVNRHRELSRDYEVHKETYGIGFVASQSRFVLLPIHVKLASGKYVWLNAILIVFENLMGILKLELPIINVSVQPLIENQCDKYIASVDDQWGMTFGMQDAKVEEICNGIFQKIADYCNINLFIHIEGRFRNVMLARFDGMPKQIDNIPDEIQEDLYRIIAAPVSKYECTSYKKTAREYIAKQSWSCHNFKYITSTTGGCLSIIDEPISDWARNLFKEDNNIDVLRPEDQESIDRMLTRSMCNNVEFALLIPILKHLNTSYIFNLKQINPVEASKVQMVYNKNLIMISSLQEHCYGTASEQVVAFERMMPYYLKEDVKAKKMEAMDRIIADTESRKNDSFQIFISIASFIIALLFGLPTIYDTFSFVRELSSFINCDIPFLTVKNASLIAWIMLMLILGVFCWSKCRKKKMIRFSPASRPR